MKKLFLGLFSLTLLFSSCSEEAEFTDSTETKQTTDSSTFQRTTRENDNYQLKKKFALALHKAMRQHVELRDFLKAEAKKKFDRDYDILYNFVRDEEVVGSTTFRELLLPFFNSETELEEIETTIEALTIFVPTLPENSFSAETWDTANEVPLVAIRLLDNDKTPLINSDGDSYLLDHDVIPGFPVVVIKECERVTMPSFAGYNENNGTEYSTRSGFRFKFSLPIFNFIFPIEINDGTPEDLIEAWEANGEEENLGWHRDYLYYNIDQANPDGPFINNHSEFLRDFRLDGDPLSALNRVADPSSISEGNLSDPELEEVVINPSGGISQGSFWTDGDFEFNVYLEYDSNQAPLPKGFPANPEDLFEIEYGTWSYLWFDFYFITDIQQKTFTPSNPPLEILTWRLHDYSNDWFLNFEEQDLEGKIESTESYESTFNTNFSFDTDVSKLGIKWGASSEETYQSSIVREYTEESNDLYRTNVHFGDNVIIEEGNVEFPLGFLHINYTYYNLRRYTTGRCSFSLVPLKVQ